MKTNVSRWTTALAVIVGGAMLATSAMAQSGAGSPPAGSSADTTKSDAPKADTPSRDSARGADREQLKAMQQALKDKGHDPGQVDGTMGPKTEAALRDYQQKEGLKATGTADAETMAKLTAAAGTPAASPGGSSSGTSSDTSSGAKTK